MTGIFQNSFDLWLEDMVPVGGPGLCSLVWSHTTQVLEPLCIYHTRVGEYLLMDR